MYILGVCYVIFLDVTQNLKGTSHAFCQLIFIKIAFQKNFPLGIIYLAL